MVTKLGRRAKYGLIDTDRGDTMIFHLGMSGHWRIDPAELGKHDHVVIETDAGRRLALNDHRRFGSLDLVSTEELASYGPFVKMGPEPLAGEFDGGYLAQALEGRSAPIKALLLDQRIVAGLGNIYVCDALNLAQIAPGRAGGQIARARLDRLAGAVKEVLTAAIAAGGSSLRDYVQARRRARLFLEGVAGLWPRGPALPALRRADSPPRRFGPIDLLLPEMPALILDVRALGT